MQYHASPSQTVESLNSGIASADGGAAAVATGSLTNI